MREITINPRFCETDALGHINNCALAPWFEQGRMGLFRDIHPDMSAANWKLILRRTEFEFLEQMVMGEPVRLITGVSRVGNSSFEIGHRAYQCGRLTASGIALMVYFNFAAGKSEPIPADVRAILAAHALVDDA